MYITAPSYLVSVIGVGTMHIIYYCSTLPCFCYWSRYHIYYCYILPCFCYWSRYHIYYCSILPCFCYRSRYHIYYCSILPCFCYRSRYHVYNCPNFNLLQQHYRSKITFIEDNFHFSIILKRCIKVFGPTF